MKCQYPGETEIYHLILRHGGVASCELRVTSCEVEEIYR